MREKGFQGVWIPREIWKNPGLSLREKILLVEISSLDQQQGCFANNRHFAEFLGISERRVQELLKSLRDSGYIEIFFLKKPGGNPMENRKILPIFSTMPQPGEGTRKTAQGAENRAAPARKTSWGYAENRAALYKDEKNILGNQESITPLNPPGPDAGTGVSLQTGEEPSLGDGAIGPLAQKAPAVEQQGIDSHRANTSHGRRAVPTARLAPELEAKVQDWLEYKRERREPYKPMGLKALLTSIQNQAERHGDQAVMELIDQCMAANYRGIIWDRLPQGRPFETNRQQPLSFSEIVRRAERGEIL